MDTTLLPKRLSASGDTSCVRPARMRSYGVDYRFDQYNMLDLPTMGACWSRRHAHNNSNRWARSIVKDSNDYTRMSSQTASTMMEHGGVLDRLWSHTQAQTDHLLGHVSRNLWKSTPEGPPQGTTLDAGRLSIRMHMPSYHRRPPSFHEGFF